LNCKKFFIFFIKILKPEESGQAIFYTFLLRHPEHKQRYAAFRNIPLENLKDTAQIKRHCMKIM
jgi:hypothetical protein